MEFEASRAKAVDKLNYFVENNLSEYSKLRNFDFGPDDRSNISCLSPYITHGVINELEVIDKSLKKFSFAKNEKFIQEVLWRVYWKGWLELRPNVWSDYLVELNNLRNEFKSNQNYLNAIEGKTNIECFNQWVKELKENNYLHNHTRMWFASIWIFTLELPWQLGAEFFMQHLYDGDAASNTLGWRWVAGVQTQGKHYLASEWNIRKFTNNRFQNIQLNENAPPIFSDKTYSIGKKDFLNFEILEDKILFLGNSNEIAESIACLKGKGPTDTMELVYAQANALGFDIGDVIANGSALNEFRLMLIRQGVDESVAQQLINEPWSVLQRSPQQYSIQVEKSGYLADLDALVIGQVLCEAGAGRSVQESDIDHGIGIEIHRSIGERVESGDAIMTLDGPFGIDIHLIQRLKQAITISDYQVKLGTRILETVTISDCPTT